MNYLLRSHAWLLLLTAFLLGWSPPASALPLLSEVFYDATGSDSASVFTELVGDAGFSLDGWSLVGVNGDTGIAYRTLALTGATIPDDGVLVIGTALASGALVGLIDFTANVDWQNGPDVVELWTPLGERADALQYGDTGGPSLGEGRPAPDADAGLSVARRDARADSDDNAADFIVTDPTPGVVPTVIPTADVTEPMSLGWLAVFLGVPSLVAQKRRRSAQGVASGPRAACRVER